MGVQPVRLEPTVAAGRPLMNTELDPLVIPEVCTKQRLAGTRCGVETSPTLAALRPLIFTSADPDAIV
jgi:hypothetical protein